MFNFLRKKDPLDEALFLWGGDRRDPFTVRDLCSNVAVFGRTGSGKSSGSGAALMRSIVEHGNISLLICAAKPEERDEVRSIYREAGCLDRLIEFTPGRKERCNFLDYIASTGGGPREVAKFMSMMRETLRTSEAGASSRDKFWEDEAERAVYNASVVVKLALGEITAEAIQRFLSRMAQTPEQIRDLEWRKGFHCQSIIQAIHAPKTAIEEHDLGIAVEYFLVEMPALNDRTRSSITTGVFGLLHAFNSGLVRQMCSGKSTFTPDDLLDGYSVLVNMPASVYGQQGTLCNVALKYLVQRAILNRHARSGDPVVGIWADEAQQVVCPSFDAHFLAQCRSHKGFMVYLSQSMSGYHALMHAAGEHQADSLMANMGHVIVHACDPVTARWASGKLGMERTSFIGGSFAPQPDLYEEIFGSPQYTGSFNESYSEVLQANEFMNGLRTGGRVNGYCVDGIVLRSGVPFADGRSYKRVTWRQR